MFDGQDRVDKLLKNIMERSKRKNSAAASAAALSTGAAAPEAAEKKKPGRKRPVAAAEAAPVEESKETKEKVVKKRAKKDTGPEKNLSAYKYVALHSEKPISNGLGLADSSKRRFERVSSKIRLRARRRNCSRRGRA